MCALVLVCMTASETREYKERAGGGKKKCAFKCLSCFYFYVSCLQHILGMSQCIGACACLHCVQLL